ncbi:glycoside hydrolase family 88 protein [Curvibacter sp. CHRR-16]|uniref:glycoside hydrolase family 88 protein n=1 Tax=Curvibacter sp. CHRR-16 TaxID=2835872 RepID=UPI001BDA1DA0|nr:glycoside hydrolase family 88 protein [Curvibacter sp. CHRR-16]MBT0569943.1 glycoside hydrolase family 88 protein [Curvibacter sp. CHRR-16]
MKTATSTPPATTTRAQAIESALATAIEQIATKRTRFSTLFPGDTTVGGHYQAHRQAGFPDGSNVGWTTGFWTGLLWMAFELTGRSEFADTARAQLPSYAIRLDRRDDVDHHDLGFLYTPSCVTAWRIEQTAQWRDTAVRAADTLMQRYLPSAGVIQAWGNLNDPLERGRIIVDCLLNLPLLHWASEVTGKTHYRAAACAHAQRSRDYLIRPDDSTFHTFHFDPQTGIPLHGSTAQGHADTSCWARGQAWAIYGFAINHRYAPELGLLDTACRVANYFLSHLPADGVAYWDLVFSEGSGEPLDSSASAIAVCGLLEIANLLPAGDAQTRYREAALHILDGLIARCSGIAPATDGLLLHGVYSKPHGRGVDEANLWGDYFFLEALARVSSHWRPHW